MKVAALQKVGYNILLIREVANSASKKIIRRYSHGEIIHRNGRALQDSFCVVQNEQGEVVKEKEVSTRTEEIEKFLREVGGGELMKGTEIGLESGQQATWLSRYL